MTGRRDELRPVSLDDVKDSLGPMRIGVFSPNELHSSLRDPEPLFSTPKISVHKNFDLIFVSITDEVLAFAKTHLSQFCRESSD